MAKKRKTKDKCSHSLTMEERKNIMRLSCFRRTMHKGLAQAEANNATWQDMVGAINLIQRITQLKIQDTLHLVKDLEKQTKKGPTSDEISREALTDKIKLANALIAQGMQWDKIDGALARAHCLCKNEDETLRGPWEFTSPELAVPKAKTEGLDH